LSYTAKNSREFGVSEERRKDEGGRMRA